MKLDIRKQWRKAWLYARQPDRFLADDVYKLDFPLWMLFTALKLKGSVQL